MRGRRRDELLNERRERDQAWSLTRDRIVQAAVEIARSEGASAVSMRRVADALRVGAMSLYWHVPNKDDLIKGMQELVFDEMGMGGPPTGDWRADLTRIATATRASLERNGWMNAYVHRRPHMSPALMRHGELSIAAVDGLGLALAEMVAVVTAVDDYVIGFVTRRESEPGTSFDRASIDDGPDVWADPNVADALASGDFPTFARHAGQPWQMSADDRFAFGLTCLLDGVERFLERRASSPEDTDA